MSELNNKIQGCRTLNFLDRKHSKFTALARISQDFDIVIIEKLIAEKDASHRRYSLGGIPLRGQGQTEITDEFSSLEELNSQVEKNMANLIHRFIFGENEEEPSIACIA